MYKKTSDNILGEFENFTNEFNIFKNYHENFELDINDKCELCDNKINLLTYDLVNFKEIFDKTKDYLLLELESNLDKHELIQLQSQNGYLDLIVFFKNSNNENILLLGEEIGRLKQIFTEKDELIKILMDKDVEKDN